MKRFLSSIGVMLACIPGIFAQGTITLTTAAPNGSDVSILVNSTSAMVPVMVDFGDGELVPFTINPDQMPSNRHITGTVKGSTIKIQGDLTELSCENHRLKSATVNGMEHLAKLDLSDNEMTDFAFETTSAVRNLDLSHNKLENSISWNSNLTLDKVATTLYDLNVSYNSGLGCLYLRGLDELTYLNASDCPNLTTAFICMPEESQLKLRSINLNNCAVAHFYPVSLPSLTTLDLANNLLVAGPADSDPFVLGDYPHLSSLNVSGNKMIQELDVTSCHEMMHLHVGGCSLSSIDLSQCPELVTFSAANNKLTSLDLGNNTELQYLYISGNRISDIDFYRLKKIYTADISDTDISRVDLYNCYYLKNFIARNTKLEWVDFNAQQPERMEKIDLRDNPGFTAQSMAYTVMTLPVARSTQRPEESLLLAGSHPELSNTEMVTGPDYHWICDSKGDGSADWPQVSLTLQDATDTGRNCTGHLDRLYPNSAYSLDYDFDIMSTDGGEFIIAQWTPQYFQDITSISTQVRRGVPVCIHPFPADGKQFRSVTVNGKEIFSDKFIIDEAATVKVNFEDRESMVTISTVPGKTVSFMVATTQGNSRLDIDWGTGTRTPYTGVRSYEIGRVDAIGTRIDGTTAGNTITIYGPLAGLDVSCYGEIGEELFGFPNNSFTAVNTSDCPTLQYLNCYWNPIASLDLSQNPELVFLDASYTSVSSLDLSHNPNMMWLAAYSNAEDNAAARINTIDVTMHPMLQHLDLRAQGIISLDLSKNPILDDLRVTNCRLTALDLTHNPELVNLEAARNSLAAIDLSKNTKLQELDLDGNNLTAIDLSANTALLTASVANNNIHTLATGMLTELGRLSINGNGMNAEELNDIFYGLPERKFHEGDDDSMAVKYNLLLTQGSDRADNDAQGSDGTIAVSRSWTPNVTGTNNGAQNSYLDIVTAPHGSVAVSDASGNRYTHGSKVKKYTQLTVTASPAEGYKFDGFRLNGEALMTGTGFIMPGIYTVLTPVFSAGAGISDATADSSAAIFSDAAGTITVAAQNGTVEVYTTAGRLAATETVAAGRATVQGLTAGTYVVRHVADTTTVKTIIVK